jgi:chromosomal replication initiator protein
MPLVPLDLSGPLARLGCPNRFYQSWLAENYTALLKEVLARAGLPVREVHFDVLSGHYPPSDADAPTRVLELDPNLTFEKFVVGPPNRLADEAAHAVAREPGSRYNPLLICGEVGEGKTHLLHAIGHRLLAHHPQLRLEHLSAARLFELLAEAVEAGRAAEFRGRVRATDVLLMDDVHTLAGREGTQEEFFHFFNALHTAGKQVVVTSRFPPAALGGVADRIRSRLSWGLVVQLDPADEGFRLDLARTICQRLRWPVQDGFLQRLVAPLELSNRELAGLLLRAAATCKLTAEEPRAVLDRVVHERRTYSTPVTMADIAREVCRHQGLAVREVRGPRRARSLSRARQLIAYLAHEHGGFSLPSIGRALGERHHTTILYAVRKAHLLISEEPAFAQALRAVRRQLNL